MNSSENIPGQSNHFNHAGALLPMLHNPLVVLRPVFDDNIKSATTSTRVTRTKAKVQAEPTVAGQPSADHSKDLAYLKRIRDHDRAKKQRQRGMTTELVRRLDSLLPAPASKKPRTMFETLASASAFLRCRSLNHTQAPAHSLREAMLTVRGAGLLVLDSSLAVIDLSPRLRAMLGDRPVPRGTPARALLHEGDADFLALVVAHLAAAAAAAPAAAAGKGRDVAQGAAGAGGEHAPHGPLHRHCRRGGEGGMPVCPSRPFPTRAQP